MIYRTRTQSLTGYRPGRVSRSAPRSYQRHQRYMDRPFYTRHVRYRTQEWIPIEEEIEKAIRDVKRSYLDITVWDHYSS